MRAYYEELWDRLPDDLEPIDFELRSRLLLDELRPGERVLDIGCGAGDFTALLSEAGAEAIGVDVARSALRRAGSRHPGLDFRLAPIDGPLPFADNAFDLVWAGEVIEHVADTAQWLSEVRRVLVPGGRLLLTTQNHGRLIVLVHGLETFSEPLGDHLHLYTRRSLRGVLDDLAFAQISVRTAGGAPMLRRILVAKASR